MKLFKRTAPGTDSLGLPSTAPQSPGNGQALRTLLPGLGAAAAGLAAAAVLLWLGLFGSAQQHQQAQLSQAWGGGQAAA
ncbi:MAG: hypothetical protein ACRERY_15405, partial [Pseudomonas sp.]